VRSRSSSKEPVPIQRACRLRNRSRGRIGIGSRGTRFSAGMRKRLSTPTFGSSKSRIERHNVVPTAARAPSLGRSRIRADLSARDGAQQDLACATILTPEVGELESSYRRPLPT
jgi:hypothetical protein